jgi:hypothetical protein
MQDGDESEALAANEVTGLLEEGFLLEGVGNYLEA